MTNRLFSTWFLLSVLLSLLTICLLDPCAHKQASAEKSLQWPAIDSDLLSKHAIRRIDGKHLTLYTDLPSLPAVDELPAVFDKALPAWRAYFGLDPAMHKDWHVTGFLMKNQELFERLDLMPVGRPPFRHGYSQGDRLWLYEQPSDYYRRHLLLHEGTHVFMDTLLGGCGPPWYMEGMAELLATHRYENGRLEMNFFPADKSRAPMWGRIKLIADAAAAGRGKSLDDVLNYGPTAHLETEAYAWCWAACALLDRHPRYQSRFRRLYKCLSQNRDRHLDGGSQSQFWDRHKNVLDADFNRRLRESIGDDWPDLLAQWQAFGAALDFGYDIKRETVRLAPAGPLPRGGKTVAIRADRGWQNSGVVLRGGQKQKYRLSASGRYQVAKEPKIWWCEPGGVTIRYYRGRPLGMLLGAVYPQNNLGKEHAKNPFLSPIAIGLETILSPQEDGVLFLKINDSPAELHDNAGRLQLWIEPLGLTD